MKETKILHLITTEDLIAGVEEGPDQDHLLMHNPLQLLLDPMSHKLGMIPYPPFAKETGPVLIRKDHILVTRDGVDDIVSQYNARFGGIITPPSNIVVPGQ